MTAEAPSSYQIINVNCAMKTLTNTIPAVPAKLSLDGECHSARWTCAAFGVTIFLLALRLMYIGLPELIPEEAYYWNYAQHPALGYLDHPPMIAWVIAGCTNLFGQTEFGVRVGAVAAWTVMAAFTFGLTRNMFGRAVAMRALMLVSVFPAYFIFGFLMTPDVLVAACWAGALYFLERALLGEKRVAWLGVGVCIGLGMLSKYTIALLGPATLGLLLLDPKLRRWFLRPEPYFAVIIMILVMFPVLVWNFQHDWASFNFQGPRRLRESPQFGFHLLLGGAALLLTPLGLIAAIKAALPVKFARHSESNDESMRRKHHFTACLVFIPLSVFIVFSLRHEPKLNWTGPIWLAAIPLIAHRMVLHPGEVTSRLDAWGRRAWPGVIVVVILIFAGALHYFAVGIPGLSYASDPARLGWRDLGKQIERLEDDIEAADGDEPLVVGMDKYWMSSELAFYRESDVPEPYHYRGGEGVEGTAGRNLFDDSSLMYSYWFDKSEYAGQTVILVSSRRYKLDDSRVASFFRSMSPTRNMPVQLNDKPAGQYFYRIGYVYQPSAVAKSEQHSRR